MGYEYMRTQVRNDIFGRFVSEDFQVQNVWGYGEGKNERGLEVVGGGCGSRHAYVTQKLKKTRTPRRKLLGK